MSGYPGGGSAWIFQYSDPLPGSSWTLAAGTKAAKYAALVPAVSDGLRIEISSEPSQAGGKKIYFLTIGDGFYVSEV